MRLINPNEFQNKEEIKNVLKFILNQIEKHHVDSDDIEEYLWKNIDMLEEYKMVKNNE